MSTDEFLKNIDPKDLPNLSMEDLVRLNILFKEDVHIVIDAIDANDRFELMRDPNFLLCMCSVLIKAYVTLDEFTRRVMSHTIAFNKCDSAPKGDNTGGGGGGDNSSTD